MKFTYFGTAAAEGIPAIFCDCEICSQARELRGKDLRARSQVLLNDSIIIDFPPDSSSNAQRFGLNMASIQNMLITHSHQDHFYPDDLVFRSYPFTSSALETLHIYGNSSVKRVFEQATGKHKSSQNVLVEFHYVEPYKTFSIEDIEVTALLANHAKDEDCYIYMIKQNGICALYGNDTGLFPKDTYNFINGKYFHFINLDCTMGTIKDGDYHMGIKDNLELLKKLEGFGCFDEKSTVVITHFSHNGGLLHNQLEEKVSQYGIITAFDGLEITLKIDEFFKIQLTNQDLSKGLRNLN